ncbi:MAG: apolipoprotein N-acyltransferase [Candidatus Omnitrophica bacterium]|nr:apolipoprotein N-acyltransferase [Candidatus Omnitrophota bacterium]
MKLRYIAFSLISGILSGLSFNFPFLSLLLWFSLVSLFFTVKNTTYRGAFLYSYLAGFVHFLVAIYWIRFVTTLGLFLLIFYLSFYWGLAGLASKRFLESKKNIIFIPFLWIILEYVRAQFGGFGWALFGYSQYRWIYLIQSADMLGVWIISFLIVYCNLLLFNFFQLPDKRPVIKQLFVFIILFFSFIAYGFLSLKTEYSSDRALSISIVQPNVGQYKKWDASYYPEIRDTLVRLTENTPRDSLVIFPEASWPYGLNDNDFADLRVFIKEVDRDLIMGIVEEERGKFHNSSFLFLKDGSFIGKYKKVNLVPFGEFVPLRRFLGFIDVLNEFGDISPGQELALFSYKDIKIATLICFEDIFPRLASRLTARGAEILVNITNDDWFKGYPEAVQHLQIAVFRAIEQRRFLIRSANTGISCVISPKGEIIKTLRRANKDVFIEGVLDEKVFSINKKTIYNILPDVLVYIGLAVCIVGSVRLKGNG